jgi:hypothetical protein
MWFIPAVLEYLKELRFDSQTYLIYAVLILYFVGQGDKVFRSLIRPSSGPNNYVYIRGS